MGGRTAHFQSAGLDSKLILAAWPKEQVLPCCTYGNPESAEVMVARSIAQSSGSHFTHVWPEGDIVAENLDAIFLANGLMVYPDRFFTAKKISTDGFDSVLDGLLGGVLLGGEYYTCDRYFSPPGRCARFLAKFIDQKISKIGIDAVTKILFADICSPQVENVLKSYLKKNFIAQLSSEKVNILQDIYNEVKSLVPPNDSVAILFRNFKIANRGRKAIVQQGVMTRQFINVYYPFADFDLMELLLKIKPTVTAYKKLYLSLYRYHFQSYSNLLYGKSLLPLKMSVLAHKLSENLLSKGISIPFITGRTSGKSLNPNNWHIWLKGSQLLRDKVISYLACEGGIGDKRHLTLQMNRLATGEETGSGKIFHLASISKWLSMTKN